MQAANDLLNLGLLLDATDLHIGPGEDPVYRQGGKLVQPISNKKLPPVLERAWEPFNAYLASQDPSMGKFNESRKIRQAIELDALNEPNTGKINENRQINQSIDRASFPWSGLNGNGDAATVRIRVKSYKALGKEYMALRYIPTKLPPIESIIHQPEYQRFLLSPESGLYLFCGPICAGKSTSMQALIKNLLTNRHFNIRILEEAIERMYEVEPGRTAMVRYQKVGKTGDVKDFMTATHRLLDEDVNVVVFGELRSQEDFKAALYASALNLKVFATMHAESAQKGITRILESFDTEAAKINALSTARNCLRLLHYQTLFHSGDPSNGEFSLKPAYQAICFDPKKYPENVKKITTLDTDVNLFDQENDGPGIFQDAEAKLSNRPNFGNITIP